MQIYKGKPCKTCGETERYRSNRKCIPCARKTSQKFRQENPDKHVDQQTQYRQNWFIKRATPAWANQDVIKHMELEAKRLEAQMGIPMHVVHDIPIRGRKVCGLHVESNLRIVSQSWRNLRRGFNSIG
jgi:hypothetical protein